MNQLEADRFAGRWIDAWNAHDLENILEHYSDSIEFSSPFAARLVGEPTVRGKEALRNYFALALERFPDLHFSQVLAFPGGHSVVLVYRSVNGLDAAETMVFDEVGLIYRVWAHYREAPTVAPIG